MVKLSDLKGNPGNPRLIKDEKFEKLKKSIKEFPRMLSIRPIIVDESLLVLGGNMRRLALEALGYSEIKDEWVKVESGLTEKQKREFIIKDNVGFGEWDWDIIANEWDAEQLEEWGLEIPNFAIQKDAIQDDYEIPDEIETDIILGDLFEIGEHRLLCGSSTEADAVGKLLNGKEPYLMITDPLMGWNMILHGAIRLELIIPAGKAWFRMTIVLTGQRHGHYLLQKSLMSGMAVAMPQQYRGVWRNAISRSVVK